MIYVKDHKQSEMYSPWDGFGPKRLDKLKGSWAGLFREHVLENLPIDLMTPFYASVMGRPSKDLSTLMGASILQEMFDLTDAETVEQLSFNVQWHYALNITDESDDGAYLCARTLFGFRQKMVRNNLGQSIFGRVTAQLTQAFSGDQSHQRLDSVHIKSNMKQLSRLSLFRAVIKKFLVNLKRGHAQEFAVLPAELIERQKLEKEGDFFGGPKPSERGAALLQSAQDAYYLMRRFADLPEVNEMPSYKQLARVVGEQCRLPEQIEEELELKAPKDIASDSLQNPSDDEASYSGHKGQGYQAQIMEVYSETEDPGRKEMEFRPIVHVGIERAHQNDSPALLAALEDVAEKGLSPEIVLADTAYGSDENVQAAAGQGVELVAPTPGRENAEQMQLSDFSRDEQGVIDGCPEGRKALEVKKKKEGYRIIFDRETCQGCQLRSQCPVTLGRRKARLDYSDKQMRLSERRREVKTETFKNRYRFRSGIEATNSRLDRRTGLKKLRVRGLPAVSFRVTFKALALNILRAAAVMASKIRQIRGLDGLNVIFRVPHLLFWVILAFARQFLRLKQPVNAFN
jgi:hypothetical protein